MKRIAVILLLAVRGIFAFSQDFSELYEGESTAGLRGAVEYLASPALKGRGAGTEGERLAAEYVAGKLSECGVEMLLSNDDKSFGMLQLAGDTLRSCNVVGVIQSYNRSLKDRYIVIGARLDNIGERTLNVDGQSVTRVYPGANGNASGLAMLISLAKTLQTNSALLGRSVIVAAFGSSLQGNAGAWYFLNRSFKDADKIDAMINLDMLGTGNSGFYAYTASNADLNQYILALENSLQPVHPKLVTAEPCASDHRAFYAKNIPSVMFTSGMYPEYNTVNDLPPVVDYGYLAREQEYIYNFAIRLSGGPAPVFNPGETVEKEAKSKVIPYYDCDRRPSFFGSTDPVGFLRKWVYVYLKYPDYARKNGIQGRVLVDFTIDEKGHVCDVRVARGADPSLDAEAVRVIEESPDWKPGIVSGKPVKSGMSVYVEFRLEKKKKR